MLFSLLVPKFPLISALDVRLKRFLHRLASIPYEAIRLSREMQETDYEAPLTVLESAGLDFTGRDVRIDGISISREDPEVFMWISISSLMSQLKAWESSKQFSGFIQERSGQYSRIRDQYERLTITAKSAFSLFQQAREYPEADGLQDAAAKFRTSLHNEEQALFSEICDFISHGVLSCCFMYASRTSTLEKMGFRMDASTRAGFSINHTIALFCMLLVFVMCNFIFFLPPGENAERILLKVTMIVSIYSAAVICAVYIRSRGGNFSSTPKPRFIPEPAISFPA